MNDYKEALKEEVKKEIIKLIDTLDGCEKQNWIPISEKMPEENDVMVLIYESINRKRRLVDICIYTNSLFTVDDCFVPRDNALYWLPINNLPEEYNNQESKDEKEEVKENHSATDIQNNQEVDNDEALIGSIVNRDDSNDFNSLMKKIMLEIYHACEKRGSHYFVNLSYKDLSDKLSIAYHVVKNIISHFKSMNLIILKEFKPGKYGHMMFQIPEKVYLSIEKLKDDKDLKDITTTISNHVSNDTQRKFRYP